MSRMNNLRVSDPINVLMSGKTLKIKSSVTGIYILNFILFVIMLIVLTVTYVCTFLI